MVGLSVGGCNGCGFLSSSFLNNSGCLGLSGLNLIKGGGGAGGLLGLGGLVRGGLRAGIGLGGEGGIGSGIGLGVGIGEGLVCGSRGSTVNSAFFNRE